MELNINIQKFIKKNIKKYYEKKEKNIKNNQKKTGINKENYIRWKL